MRSITESMRFQTSRFAPSCTIPDAPPAEVLDAIDAAADAYDRLHAAGHRLHFHTDRVTRKLTVQVLGLAGELLGTVPGGTVLDVVSGGTLHCPTERI
jgi:hypothetical protein